MTMIIKLNRFTKFHYGVSTTTVCTIKNYKETQEDVYLPGVESMSEVDHSPLDTAQSVEAHYKHRDIVLWAKDMEFHV